MKRARPSPIKLPKVGKVGVTSTPKIKIKGAVSTPVAKVKL